MPYILHTPSLQYADNVKALQNSVVHQTGEPSGYGVTVNSRAQANTPSQWHWLRHCPRRD